MKHGKLVRTAITDKPQEACGVFGIYGEGGINIAQYTYFALFALQHRGQESAGMAIWDGVELRDYKATGLVNEVFTAQVLEELSGGYASIGHVRYARKEEAQAVNSQPLVFHHLNGSFCIGLNGSIINGVRLRRELQQNGTLFQTDTDAETVACLIAGRQDLPMETALGHAMEQIKGAYALTLLGEDKLIGARDPKGIRPLCLGQLEGHYVLASETSALDIIEADFVRDIEPGEVIVISKEGIQSHFPMGKQPRSLCVFEYVYFARPDSVIDGQGVYSARVEAGKLLAKGKPVEADIVIGVPDSALAAAAGYAEASGLPQADGIIKNKYAGRTFIQPVQSLREITVRMKLNALRENVAGKRVVLVDDSIVRGTTSMKLVQMLRRAGAKEVHMRICSPPVVHPCPYGIDTANETQLIANQHNIDEIARIIGVDTLAFLPIEALIEASGGGGFCSGCFNRDYGMDVEEFFKGV